MNTNAVTLLDSGMGKTLGLKGVEIPETIWSANALLVAPDVVKEIHRENIEAGAQVITTNSYGVILADLAKIGIENQYDSLNELAGKLAVEAVRESGRQIEIAASLPPQNGSFRPDLVLDRYRDG
jgi:S-methylmethionine-dependent homocysteine/selenocysteine methylase